MESQTNAAPFLPEDVRNIIWRIIGNDESPLKRETTSRLIEGTINSRAKRIPQSTRDHAIAVVHEWFEFHGDKGWLKETVRESVAHMIIDGIKQALSTQSGIDNHETAFCAVGSIQPTVAIDIINSSWSRAELDTFIGYSLKMVKTLCDKGAVLNPDRIERLDVSGARASMDAVQDGERLETYLRLKDYDWWLHSSVANMIEFLVKVNPRHLYDLAEMTDDPVVHLRAARCASDGYAPTDNEKPLQWLTNNSTDPLIALAIVHILDTVNRLDSDRRWDIERGHERDTPDPSASYLLEGAVQQLSKLEPVRRAHWIVELLSHGVSALNLSGRDEKPYRVEQVEELCTQQLERLVRDSWSDELAGALRSGLCLSPLVPRTLPLAQVAFDIRDSEPERSAEVARLILKAHERQIAESLNGDRGFFYNLNSWRQLDWVNSLGIALVLSDEALDLPGWVAERCRALPLSVWNVEEDYDSFLNAERVAQFRFLVALYAIQMLESVGRIVDPAWSLILAESFWKHCQFARRHISLYDGSDVSAFAARVAVHLGKPGIDWVLDQAEKPGVGPRALLALIQQQISSDSNSTEDHGIYQLTSIAELYRIASVRFGNPRGLGLTELYHLGELWLLLDKADGKSRLNSVSDEAEATAVAIDSFPQRQLTRAYKVLALKLLAFASSEKRLPPEEEKRIETLYGELWTAYTPTEERAERQRIDNLLRSSELSSHGL